MRINEILTTANFRRALAKYALFGQAGSCLLPQSAYSLGAYSALIALTRSNRSHHSNTPGNIIQSKIAKHARQGRLSAWARDGDRQSQIAIDVAVANVPIPTAIGGFIINAFLGFCQNRFSCHEPMLHRLLFLTKVLTPKHIPKCKKGDHL